MTNQCPNCKGEFSEHRETCYFCPECQSWFKNVDGSWRSCPEPVKPADPPPPEPPKLEDPPEPEPEPAVRSYLGGLVTVEEIDDETDD
jgi:hypothetical protein